MLLLIASGVSPHPCMAGDLVSSSVEVCLLDSGMRVASAGLPIDIRWPFLLGQKSAVRRRAPSWLLYSVWDDLAQLACTEPRRSGWDYPVGRAGRAPVTSQLITPALMR